MARTSILTQLAVDKTKARGRRCELPDGPAGVPGFALRIGETGSKSYVLRYRVGGRQRRVTIGSAAVLSLAEARARARKLVDQAKGGIDPAAAGAERRAQAKNTVAAVAEEYCERHLRRNLKSGHWTERRLKTDIVAGLGAERQIRSITKGDVIRLVDDIADRGKGVMANRTLQLVGRFFAWAQKRGIVDASPAFGVELPHKEQPRNRVLTEAELVAVWRAFEVIGYPFGVVGRLLLLTGARRSEVAGLRWSEVDFKGALWTVPAERVKSGAEHAVPLVPEALALLKAIPRIDGSDLVFPSSRAGASAISGFSGALARVHELSVTAGWSWHDCRRSVRTGLAKLGVRPDIAERVLGHSVGGKITKTYDHYQFEPEVRAALTLWSAEVERIVTGAEAKVVALRAAAG